MLKHRKALGIAVIAIAVIVIYVFFVPHTVSHVLDGYIVYLDGSEVSCSVSVRGKYQYNPMFGSTFDGTIYANDVPVGYPDIRVTFFSGDGITEYCRKEADNVNFTGNLLMDDSCKKVVLSCCYDAANQRDTADEAYRCLIIAPAQNISEAKNVLASFKENGHLQHFTTWDFENSDLV